MDHGDHTFISGWAYDRADADGAVELEVFLGETLISTLKADGYRKDLRLAGYGNGCHAFKLPLPSATFTAPILTLHVRVVSTGEELVGSPVTVVNRLTLLNESTRAVISAAIAVEAAEARAAGQLQGLAAWLLQQFDTIYQRQASLESSAHARTNRFFDLVGEQQGLSETLRQAAEAVLVRYPALHLAEVEKPEVSVLIPAFNQFASTYRCLASIFRHLPKATIEIVLIDDGSTDETVYAGMLLSGGLRVIRGGANRGFVGSIILGAEAARGRYLLLLNNDTEVQSGWLDELVATFQRDATIGVAGAKLVSPDGVLQEAGGLIWRQANGHNWGRGQDPMHCGYCYMRDSDYVSGAGLLISRKVYDEVGGLSVEFAPGYYDDVDLCFKVSRAGYRVVVQPQSRLIHHEGTTSGTDPTGAGMKRFQRINQAVFLAKWFEALQQRALGPADPNFDLDLGRRPRVLFIDETVPTPDQDAGSNAALEHMKGLQRLGYAVAFVGSDNMAKISPYTEALERLGIECFYAPYYWSVEEVLRRQNRPFDLFYVHRLNNMTKYQAMIRRGMPKARIVFNVADLHHLRKSREARVAKDKSLAADAERVKEAELAAVRRADRVIVHSSFEKEILATAGVKRGVHVIPWVVRPEPVRRPFPRRFGMALIGGFNHPPNVDAALWLAAEIMPLVEAEEPGLECLLIGSQMPASVLALRSRAIRPLGHVPDLNSVLQGLRLTVAPLRFGAGLKGKVLTSLAAGLPCVMTPCAAEGMGLPVAFGGAIASTAREIAARVVAIHRNPELNGTLAEAGLRYIAATCSQQRVDGLLRAMLN